MTRHSAGIERRQVDRLRGAVNDQLRHRLAGRRRVAPLMIVYFCQGWTGWLFVTWMPSLLQKNYGVEIKKSALLYMALLFSGFLAELIGGMTTDFLLRRTGSLQIARSLMIAGSWVFAVAGLVPVILFHDMFIGVSGFMVTVFFLGFAISPLWRHDGHRARLRRHFELADECLRCRRRHSLTGRLRLDPRPHRQLDAAVRGFGLSVAVRHRHDLLDPARPPDRSRFQCRQAGGGGRVDHSNGSKRRSTSVASSAAAALSPFRGYPNAVTVHRWWSSESARSGPLLPLMATPRHAAYRAPGHRAPA